MRGSIELPLLHLRGRGAASNPANRFEELFMEPDPEAGPASPVRTRFFRDLTRSAVSRNQSPDLAFDYTVNPYRGCEHGCIYCYARPTHEYLGLSAGLDFESRIFVKERLPDLLRKELSSRSWRPGTIVIAGVTDAYQPVERRLGLTRRTLEVLVDFGNPVGIITKNHLVVRDTDLLGELAAASGAMVSVSVTTLDAALQRRMEPRTSSPEKRLEAVARLAEAGIPAGVMIAPVVPGLTDHEIPGIVEAAARAGAQYAGVIPLRLPHGVASLFQEWLEIHFPDRAGKVLGRLREIRGGRLNDPRFGSRMCGEGEYATSMAALFHAACRKHGLSTRHPRLSTAGWRGPTGHPANAAQLGLFEV